MTGRRAVQERAFHRWLRHRLVAGREGLLPLGDDAAALAPPAGRVAVWTIDTLVEGTHFPRAAPPRWIGRAATGVSLSDLAAKGATPAGLVIALQLPAGTPDAWARAVLLGAEQAAARFGARVVGGDTKASPTRAVVSSALGWARPDRLAPRTAARPGELVVVTGVVGRGGVAARRFYRHPRDPRAHRELLDVRPRVAEGRILGRYASAMLDTSDGLAEAARLLASASRVGILLEEAKIPWARGLVTAPWVDRLRWGTFGGDYELLATVRPNRLLAARSAVARAGGRLTVIGTVTPGRRARLLRGRRTEPLRPSTWDPFGRGGGPDGPAPVFRRLRDGGRFK
ncbi:MAG: thiamine-phosphate kinase [Thermoplasmata archaeon]